jgi:hypothetical protein
MVEYIPILTNSPWAISTHIEIYIFYIMQWIRFFLYTEQKSMDVVFQVVDISELKVEGN